MKTILINKTNIEAISLFFNATFLKARLKKNPLKCQIDIKVKYEIE